MNTNILDYGARPDTEKLCTKEIQAAVDACAASGGGRVTVPAGKYVTGTVWLKSNVELHLEHGSVIKGSDDLDDYNAEDAYEQNFSSRTNEKWLGKHLIIAHECENVAVTGTGTFDGNGDHFYGEATYYSAYVWREGMRTAKSAEECRPGQLICFIQCRHVRLENISVTNQPCWGCFFHGCEYVSIRGLRTNNDHRNFNSDGIDIDCCRFVTVSDCIIDTGDDCIAIRGAERRLKNKPHPCEYVTVTNCVLGSSSNAIRIGVGDGKIRHVRISNITITRAAPAITLQSSYCGRGCVSIEDVGVIHVSATNCARVFEIVEGANVSIKDVTLENFYVETNGYFHLYSDFSDSVSNITMRNWKITMTAPPEHKIPRDYERKGTVWFRARNICNFTLENISVNDENNDIGAWQDGSFSFDGCKGLKFLGVSINGEEQNV